MMDRFQTYRNWFVFDIQCFAVTHSIAQMELKFKYKFRLLLDESFSFGTVGRTGRGLTELYNVPVCIPASSFTCADQIFLQAADVDMIVGSVANSLSSCGGFCAGSRVVVDHQRINGTSFVFSAAMPAALAVSASEGINILRDAPSIMTTLQENVRAVHAVLDKVDCIIIPSHPASPIIHLQVKPLPTTSLAPPSASSPPPLKKSQPNSVHPYNPQSFDIIEEERLLQQVVEESLAQGVLITRSKHLRGQELVEPRPSIRLAITTGLSKKDCEKAAGVVKAALIKVLGKRR